MWHIFNSESSPSLPGLLSIARVSGEQATNTAAKNSNFWMNFGHGLYPSLPAILPHQNPTNQTAWAASSAKSMSMKVCAKDFWKASLLNVENGEQMLEKTCSLIMLSFKYIQTYNFEITFLHQPLLPVAANAMPVPESCSLPDCTDKSRILSCAALCLQGTLLCSHWLLRFCLLRATLFRFLLKLQPWNAYGWSLPGV